MTSHSPLAGVVDRPLLHKLMPETLSRDELMTKLQELGVKFRKNASTETLEGLLKECEYVLTQDDLENNPDLAIQGLKEGDVIYLPVVDDVGDEPKAETQVSAPEKPKKEVPPEPIPLYVVSRVRHNGRVFEKGEKFIEPSIPVRQTLFKAGALTNEAPKK